MAIFGSHVSTKVRVALDKRKKLLNYNNNEARLESAEMLSLYSKTPWISMHSCIEYRNDQFSEEPRIQYLFLGAINKGLGGFENMLSQRDATQPFRPVPGIDSLSVALEGTFGSIRKADISLKCWTISDLEMIEALFMNVQGSIVIQWGWATEDGMSSFVKIEDEREEIFNYDRLKEKRRDSNGDWDAFVGRVVNFSWTGNESLGFDISLEIMSPGNSILAQKVEDTEDTDEIDRSSIIDYMESEAWTNLLNRELANKDAEVFGIADSSIIPFLGGTDKYVTLRWFEKNVISRFFETLSYDKFDSEDVLVGSHPLLRSMQPDICILPGFLEYQNVVSTTDKNIIIPGFFLNRENLSTGVVSNILINTNVIKDAILNNATLSEAIDYILEKINSSCLNYFELKYETPEGKNTTKLIDIKKIHNDAETGEIDESLVYVFELLKRNSIVRSYSMASNIPDSFKTAAMMSKNIDNNKFGLHIIKGLYGSNYDTYDEYISDKSSTSDRNKYTKKKENWWTKTLNKAKFAAGLFDGTTEQRRDWVDKNIKSNTKKKINQRFYSEWKKRLQNDDDKNHTKYNQEMNNRLIPIELTLTMDGVSGFDYGNIFTVDYLPSRYNIDNDDFKLFTYFQITDVKHSIGKDSWTTEITGLMRIKLIVKKFASSEISNAKILYEADDSVENFNAYTGALLGDN